MSGLRKLRVNAWDGYDLKALHPLKKLESLSFYSKTLTDLTPLQDLTSLRKLSLSTQLNCDLAPIAKLKNLTELGIYNVTTANDLTPIGGLESLEILKIKRLSIQPKDLQTISGLKKLRELEYHTRGRKVLHPSALRDLTNLETLNIGADPGVKSFDWARDMKNLRDVHSDEGTMGSRRDIASKDRHLFSPFFVHDREAGRDGKAIYFEHADEPNLSLFRDPRWKTDSINHIRLDWSRIENVSRLSEIPWPALYSLGLSHTQIHALPTLTTSESLFLINAENSRVADISNLADTKVVSLNLAGTDVTNIDALASCQELASLNLAETEVSELAALRDLKQLENLNVGGTRVASMDVVGALKLKKIVLDGLPFSDLSQLNTGIHLTHLSCKDCPIESLQPIKWFPNIQVLNLHGTQVRDVQPILTLGRLNSLNLADTPVESLPKLRILNELYQIDLSGTKITELSPLLPHNRLSAINISRTPVVDISPIAGDKLWDSVDLSDTQISDISGLRVRFSLNMAQTPFTDLSQIEPLEKRNSSHFSLNLSGTQVTDISPLIRIEQLTELILAGTHVKDFSPLSELKAIHKLDLSSTEFSDVSILNCTHMGMHKIGGRYARARPVELNLSNTKVNDIRDLATMTQLASLNLEGTKVEDFSPLRAFLPYGLDVLNLRDCKIPDFEVLQHLAGLLHLKINCGHVESLKPLSSLRMLESLNLQNLHAGHDLKTISKLPYLLHLEINGTIGDLQPLANLRHIRKLHLPAGTRIPDGFIDALPTLDELRVGGEVIHATKATRWTPDPEHWSYWW